MSRLLTPTIWTGQPQQTVELAQPYKQHAELVFNANSLLLRNQGKTFNGKVLTRNATYAAIKPNVFGRGIYTTDGANPAFQDATWALPIMAGSGDFSCVFALQPTAGAAAHSQHLILNSSAGKNACFYVIINGYMPNGASTFTNESGTLWCGTYYGDSLQNGRGVKKAGVVNGSPITGVYNRFKDGRHELWLNGALVDSYTNAYVMPFEAGTHTVRVNSAYGSVSLIADLDRCFPAAEAASVSANPFQIFAPVGGVIYAVESGTPINHDLTGSGITAGTPTLGTPTVSIESPTNHALTAADITAGTPTLGTPTIALAPIVQAERVHVKNLQTGTVYYTKGLTTGDTRPASITKLMTALLLVEAKPTKAELVAQSVTMLVDAINEGTSATFQTGDVTNLHDLLAMAQLPSDNAAAAMIGYVIGKESLGGTPTYAQAKTEFVSLMNARAAALGMTQTTYINAHGLDNNASSPKDTNLVMAALVKNRILRNIWRFSSWNFTVTRSATPTALQSPAAYGNGYPGMVGGKGGSLTDLYNRGVLWEAPNGQMCAITTFGSTTYNDLEAGLATIIASLPVDYPELATPATPFTPAYLFDTLGMNGGWFDGSDTSHMWQDAAGTTQVTGTSQPVGKWAPKSGNASIYWRQTTDAARPTYAGTSTGLQFDGTNDYLDLGAASFGDASLFADDTERFMVVQKFASAGASGTLVAKAGATTTNRTFHSYVDSGTGAEPGLWMRGAQTLADANLADGSQHGANVFWDGERGGMGRIDLGAKHVLLGTASEESQNILLGARTGGTASFLNGSVQQIVLVDTYDDDVFRRLRDWSNGATINAFPYSAGMVEEELDAAGITAGIPTLGTPTIAQDHALTSNDILSGEPTLGAPSLAQNHQLSGLGIICEPPTLGAAMLAQDHALSGAFISSGIPVLGSPTLETHPEDTYALTASGIESGTPILSTPTIAQDHALIGSAIAAGTPVFGPVTLAQQHALMAGGISAGVPVLGTPSLVASGGEPVWPLASDVLLGVIYGPTGTEYTGTLSGTGATPEQIAAAVWAYTLP